MPADLENLSALEQCLSTKFKEIVNIMKEIRVLLFRLLKINTKLRKFTK